MCTRPVARPRLEQIESRELPSGSLPWPITGDQPPILSTYGQFIEGFSIHLHEGLDIIADTGTPVTAVENGEFYMGQNNGIQSDYVDGGSPDRNGNHGWDYSHATPTIPLINGQVLQGQIANVAPAPAGYPAHLHLGYTAITPDPFVNGALRPAGNPLDYLVSKDTVAPTVVPGSIHFRVAASDFNGALTPVQSPNPNIPAYEEALAHNHKYFVPSIVPGVGVPIIGASGITQDADGASGGGSTDVDIIADVYDQATAGGRHVAPESVSFQIFGDSNSTIGDNTGWVTPFAFTGEFLNRASTGGNDPGGNDIRAFYDVNLTRTIYEHDVQSQSVEGQDYYFILTNYNGNNRVEFSATDLLHDDRSRSWQSNVSRDSGKHWYDALDPADRATWNARSQFRDGFYQVQVRGKDASNNVSSVLSQRFLLLNYARDFTGQSIAQGQVRVTGFHNFLAGDQVPVYDFYGNSPPPAGLDLTNSPNVVLLGDTVPTDQNGNLLQPTTLNFIPFSGFQSWLIADYDHDHIYHFGLDSLFVGQSGGSGPMASPGKSGSQPIAFPIQLVNSSASAAAASISPSVEAETTVPDLAVNTGSQANDQSIFLAYISRLAGSSAVLPQNSARSQDSNDDGIGAVEVSDLTSQLFAATSLSSRVM
jgi:hypothetical protein